MVYWILFFDKRFIKIDKRKIKRILAISGLWRQFGKQGIFFVIVGCFPPQDRYELELNQVPICLHRKKNSLFISAAVQPATSTIN